MEKNNFFEAKAQPSPAEEEKSSSDFLSRLGKKARKIAPVLATAFALSWGALSSETLKRHQTSTKEVVKSNQEKYNKYNVFISNEELEEKYGLSQKFAKDLSIYVSLSGCVNRPMTEKCQGRGIVINPPFALEKALNHKIKKNHAKEFYSNGKGAKIKERSEKRLENYQKLWDKHQITRYSVQGYTQELNRIITKEINLEKNVDWIKVNRDYFSGRDHLGLRQKNAQRLAQLINGQELAAITMTELYPWDGETNCKVFNFVLKEAGSEFFLALPAFSDNLESSGYYQITKIPTPDIEKLSQCVDGRGKLTERFPYEKKISHHQAAVLNIMNNSLFAVGCLDGSELKELEKRIKSCPNNVRAFQVSANFSPAEARQVLKIWLRPNNSKVSFRQVARLKGFPYGEKAWGNIVALSRSESPLPVAKHKK